MLNWILIIVFTLISLPSFAHQGHDDDIHEHDVEHNHVEGRGDHKHDSDHHKPHDHKKHHPDHDKHVKKIKNSKPEKKPKSN